MVGGAISSSHRPGSGLLLTNARIDEPIVLHGRHNVFSLALTGFVGYSTSQELVGNGFRVG